MVKIRLRRMGKSGRPSYRVVVADVHSPRDGKFIDVLGFYDPIPEPAVINIDLEKAKDWIKREPNLPILLNVYSFRQD